MYAYGIFIEAEAVELSEITKKQLVYIRDPDLALQFVAFSTTSFFSLNFFTFPYIQQLQKKSGLRTLQCVFCVL